jgi:hypothetical protein
MKTVHHVPRVYRALYRALSLVRSMCSTSTTYTSHTYARDAHPSSRAQELSHHRSLGRREVTRYTRYTEGPKITVRRGLARAPAWEEHTWRKERES